METIESLDRESELIDMFLELNNTVVLASKLVVRITQVYVI
jgi:hypothetical protein